MSKETTQCIQRPGLNHRPSNLPIKSPMCQPLNCRASGKVVAYGRLVTQGSLTLLFIYTYCLYGSTLTSHGANKVIMSQNEIKCCLHCSLNNNKFIIIGWLLQNGKNRLCFYTLQSSSVCRNIFGSNPCKTTS